MSIENPSPKFDREGTKQQYVEARLARLQAEGDTKGLEQEDLVAGETFLKDRGNQDARNNLKNTIGRVKSASGQLEALRARERELADILLQQEDAATLIKEADALTEQLRSKDKGVRIEEGPEVIIREKVRAELMEGCDRLRDGFRALESEGLSNLSPELVNEIKEENKGVYQSLEAYREGVLDIISQTMPGTELIAINKAISDFFEEMNRRLEQGEERVMRARSRQRTSA